MFSKLLEIIVPSPLTGKWLSNNATRCARIDFEAQAKGSGAIPIFHVTDRASALSIYQSGRMFGIDVVSSAHFHYTPSGAGRQAIAGGILLGFSWRGALSQVDLCNDASSHRNRQPNVLFDVPISEYNDETWELRLYPGTTNLTLGFIESAEGGFLLCNSKSIEVIQGE